MSGAGFTCSGASPHRLGSSYTRRQCPRGPRPRPSSRLGRPPARRGHYYYYYYSLFLIWQLTDSHSRFLDFLLSFFFLIFSSFFLNRGVHQTPVTSGLPQPSWAPTLQLAFPPSLFPPRPPHSPYHGRASLAIVDFPRAIGARHIGDNIRPIASLDDAAFFSPSPPTKHRGVACENPRRKPSTQANKQVNECRPPYHRGEA